MRVVIPQNKLKEGLRIIERIAQKSLTLPILGSVLVKAKENFLNLKTTDLEIGINWWGLAKIEEEGEIAVPVKIFSDLVSFLPNKPLTLISRKNILAIECGNYRSQIKGQGPEEFPIIPEIKGGEDFSVKAIPFCQALTRVSDIPASSLARPGISGIYFSFEKNLLKMVATDSFRLGEKTFSLENFSKKTSFILPQKAARELINIFGEIPGEIKVIFSPNQILFESLIQEIAHPRIHFTSKLIGAEYPDYQEIIPKKFKTQILLRKDEFLNQIRMASLFSGKINEIKLNMDPQEKKVEVMSQNPELGEYKSQFPGKIKGEKVEVSFNHKFLSDGVLKIESPKLVFELNGDTGPGILRPLEDQTYLYVVMPIKPS